MVCSKDLSRLCGTAAALSTNSRCLQFALEIIDGSAFTHCQFVACFLALGVSVPYCCQFYEDDCSIGCLCLTLKGIFDTIAVGYCHLKLACDACCTTCCIPCFITSAQGRCHRACWTTFGPADFVFFHLVVFLDLFSNIDLCPCELRELRRTEMLCKPCLQQTVLIRPQCNNLPNSTVGHGEGRAKAVEQVAAERATSRAAFICRVSFSAPRASQLDAP